MCLVLLRGEGEGGLGNGEGPRVGEWVLKKGGREVDDTRSQHKDPSVQHDVRGHTHVTSAKCSDFF